MPSRLFASPGRGGRGGGRLKWLAAFTTAGVGLMLGANWLMGVGGAADEPVVVKTFVQDRDDLRRLDIPWPAQGQAAVSANGRTVASPDQRSVPIASITKVMTAYVFLRHHRLEEGLPGPSYAYSVEEAARYGWRAARNESLTPERPAAGEVFTQRRALEAMMAVSANNVAHEIARWCSGDETVFVKEMNDTARSMGMESTTYTDPSGYDPGNVSTAADQAKLFAAALKEPSFAAVAGAPYVAADGTRNANRNPLLGQAGVFAGKTGTTTHAGRNLVVARRTSAGSPEIVVVLGQAVAERRSAVDAVSSILDVLPDGSRASAVSGPGGTGKYPLQ
ncbi:D-alanyl-D-alanine carboxypeptidase family protein [Streptomyces vinaceus]|uniref:D-alanyl-D-alanine carboxypeptidase family protein n=1 Tax=Streptomyces vinaceus TaxID=1960 RepID=UPI0038021CEF